MRTYPRLERPRGGAPRSFALLAALGLAVGACEEPAVVETDAATTPPDAARSDAGPRPETVLRYTPEGCSYEVATPGAASPINLGGVFATGMSEPTFGAAATPTQIHSSFVGPTESSFAVVWHSDRDTLASTLLLGTDRGAVEAASGPSAEVREVLGHHTLFASNPRGAAAERAHEVHVCGLSPSTTYYYRVGGPGHYSETFEITTGPTIGASEPFSFGVTGDARGNNDEAWTLSQERLHGAGVDFELFTGDAVELGIVQAQWNAFFSASRPGFAVQDFLAGHPFMIANGNHDALSINYLAMFALPQDVSPGEFGDGEEWYSFDYGNAHFIFLNDTVVDAGTIANEEADWLRADLMAVDRARTPWVFAVHHRAMYTCMSVHDPELPVRAAWQPILDEFQVDMVFEGHNHVYERTRPIRGLDAMGEGIVAAQDANSVPVITAGEPSGTIYLLTGTAGAPLYRVSAECATSTAGAVSERNYVVVEIEGRTIHVTVRNTLTGDIIDEFEYTK